MAEVSPYVKGFRKYLDGEIDIVADTMKVAIVKTSYVFDKLTEFFDTGDDDVNDPSAEEIVATDYLAAEVTPTVFDIGTGDGKIGIAIPDVNFGAIGGAVNDTGAGCILYKDTGTPTTSPVLLYFPFTANGVTTGSPVTLDFNTEAEGGNIRLVLPSQA